MCGFCLEGSVLRDLLDAMVEDVDLPDDSFSFLILLQEAHDWRKMYQAWGAYSDVRVEVIALCRQWSERLAPDVPRSSSANDAPISFKDLPGWLSTLSYRPEWQWVLHINEPLPEQVSIDAAMAELDAYIDECLRPPDAGVTGWNFYTLTVRFLGVSVAFDVLARDAPNDARITLLATTSPERAPSFEGYDLWLQRRALRFCVTRHGVSFLTTHLNELRVETIYSVIMSDLLSFDDLQKIKISIKNYTNPPMNLTIEDLSEALDAKVNMLSNTN
jgi:hypothetical protein